MALFRSGEPRPASEKIENVIGPSAEFQGDLTAEGGVRIDGTFEGTVESESNVIIGENARVVAGVSAFNITVAGLLQGNVKAVGRLEILATGRVLGDVQVGSLLIEEGGVFHGQSLMDEEETPPEEEEHPAKHAGGESQDQREQQARGYTSQESAETTQS